MRNSIVLVLIICTISVHAGRIQPRSENFDDVVKTLQGYLRQAALEVTNLTAEFDKIFWPTHDKLSDINDDCNEKHSNSETEITKKINAFFAKGGATEKCTVEYLPKIKTFISTAETEITACDTKAYVVLYTHRNEMDDKDISLQKQVQKLDQIVADCQTQDDVLKATACLRDKSQQIKNDANEFFSEAKAAIDETLKAIALVLVDDNRCGMDAISRMNDATGKIFNEINKCIQNE